MRTWEYDAMRRMVSSLVHEELRREIGWWRGTSSMARPLLDFHGEGGPRFPTEEIRIQGRVPRGFFDWFVTQAGKSPPSEQRMLRKCYFEEIPD